ncbi:MAG: hydrogenase maturation protease [Planctomycetota bacterium]|nr:hydrogenase maturation protease [Planctomycetota bacterium]
MSHVPSHLCHVLRRPWLLVGIGNDMRGDDAFGPLLARRLLAGGLPAIDAGMAPENVTGPVRRSDAEVLILADATDLGEPTGTVRLLRSEDLLEGGTSTHDPSLRLLLDFLTAERSFDVHVLVAQAGSRELGDPPSQEVLAAVYRLGAAFEAETLRRVSDDDPRELLA